MTPSGILALAVLVAFPAAKGVAGALADGAAAVAMPHYCFKDWIHEVETPCKI